MRGEGRVNGAFSRSQGVKKIDDEKGLRKKVPECGRLVTRNNRGFKITVSGPLNDVKRSK